MGKIRRQIKDWGRWNGYPMNGRLMSNFEGDGTIISRRTTKYCMNSKWIARQPVVTKNWGPGPEWNRVKELGKMRAYFVQTAWALRHHFWAYQEAMEERPQASKERVSVWATPLKEGVKDGYFSKDLPFGFGKSTGVEVVLFEKHRDR